MKKYKDYMDGVRASGALHQRLLELEASGKRPVPWARYGTVAAALVLVCGLGAWGLGHGGWEAIQANFKSLATYCVEPEIADALQPDIAPENPGYVTEPGEKTIGGYEVTDGEMVSYYVLPYIDYGGLKPSVASAPPAAADWDISAGAARRELTQGEIITLMGGKDAVYTHLDWGEYQLTGWAAWYEDGSFWGAYINGEKIPAGLPQSASYPCPDDRFEFAVTADQLPPTCIVYSATVPQEVRGLTITAEGYDSVAGPEGGVDASTRRVSFMKDGYGYRFDITGTSRALTEERVSRLVARVAGEGLGLYSVDGTADVCYPEDATYTCDICGNVFPVGTFHSHPFMGADEDGSASTEPYDPNEAADPSYNAPGTYVCEVCGNSVRGGIHFHVILNEDGTYTCDSCGVTLLEEERHYHNTAGDDMCSGYPVPNPAESWPVCGLPPAPATLTCGVCGQTYYEGAEHQCAGHHSDHHGSGHH